MSKQNSVLKVKGKLDDVSYYESGGKKLARVAKGPATSTVKTSDKFKRTRENMSEFGGAIAATKSFRAGLSTAIKSMADGRLSNRLTSLFKKIGNRDIDGIRGQRSIMLSENRESFNRLDLNIKTPFTTVCTAPYNAVLDAARNNCKITFTGFSPDQHAVFPPGSNHCRLVLAMGVFSDHKFDELEEKYLPVNPAVNGLGAIIGSDLIALTATPADLSLDLVLPGAPVIDVESSVIVCIGIEFYERIGTKDYLFARNNAMAVIKVA